jgi:hypothetical protein
MVQYAIGRLGGAPEIAQAIGNMVVAWAYAEDHLVIALHKITGMHPNMALAAYHRIPTFESRVKMLLAAWGQWNPDPAAFDKAAIKTAIEKLSKLAATRNGFIHGAWQRNPKTGEIFLINMRAISEDGINSKEVKASDINQHIEAVIGRAKALDALIGAPKLP